MSRRLTLVLALAILIGVTAYAYAEVQNIKVSGDILLRAVSREAFTFKDYEWPCGGVHNPRARDDYFLSTMRVRIDADLTDNVAATVRLLNERMWGEEETQSGSSSVFADGSQVNVDLAYITLREFLYSPLTLIVGRQNLRFGNALIVGDPDTNLTYLGGKPQTSVDIWARDLSARKAFDAIRATLDYSPWVFDVIYAMIDENDPTVSDDTTLHGVNARYDFGDNKNTIAEAYYFVKKLRENGTGTKVKKANEVHTVGLRAQSEPIQNLTLNAEVAHQFGDYMYQVALYPNDSERSGDGRVDRDAWAVQLGADYIFADVQYTPTVGLWYTYLSGEKDGDYGRRYRGWDPMFEDQAGGTIYNAILAASNCHMINLKGSFKPREDVTASLCWSHLLLDKKYVNNSLQYLSGSSSLPQYRMKDKDDLGDEIDLNIIYDYTEDVQLGLNAGVFMPGDAFHEDNDRSAYQLIGSMKVTF